MADADEFPFRGWVIWLTPGQGGRQAGPPIPRTTRHYCAATAYVPPHTADTGLASFVLRNFDAGTWRSPAERHWLAADVSAEQLVKPGSVIAVTEGSQVAPRGVLAVFVAAGYVHNGSDD
jgi:hypothetical protein